MDVRVAQDRASVVKVLERQLAAVDDAQSALSAQGADLLQQRIKIASQIRDAKEAVLRTVNEEPDPKVEVTAADALDVAAVAEAKS